MGRCALGSEKKTGLAPGSFYRLKQCNGDYWCESSLRSFTDSWAGSVVAGLLS
jgi:hypothetical protein